jgi:hypothetical protein
MATAGTPVTHTANPGTAASQPSLLRPIHCRRTHHIHTPLGRQRATSVTTTGETRRYAPTTADDTSDSPLFDIR